MASVIRNWGEILRTQNLSPDQRIDTVSRWLLITRACVFPMTLISVAIGALLAGCDGHFPVGTFLLVMEEQASLSPRDSNRGPAVQMVGLP